MYAARPAAQPCEYHGILACRAALGEGVPQVAVFDTAFHQTMPEHAYLYSIPYAFYEKDRMRRYGFHGHVAPVHLPPRGGAAREAPGELKLVSCHLGNGASLAAIDCGRCVDTSMGMTPLAGLTMGTRAGDMDAGVVEYIANKYSMTVSETVRVLNKESGVLGLSGVSSDFRDLHAAAGQGHRRAALALDVFCYGVRKMIAGYAAAMGGVDTVVFTAGVGENSADTRARILRGLEFMGHHLRRGEEPLQRRGAHHLARRRARHGDGRPHKRGADDRAGHLRAGCAGEICIKPLSKKTVS